MIKMKIKIIIRQSRSWTIIFQFIALLLLAQVLILSNPLIFQSVSASDLTFNDTIWENGGNDAPSIAYDLPSYSITNDPATPLNVSTLRPDYYNFSVLSGFYFSVFIEFNQTNLYNDSLNHSNRSILIFTEPPFYADIDIQLLAANGSSLGESNGAGSEEAIGPIYTTSNEELTINVTAVNPEIGYENIDYSTTYNMSIIYDDEWEILQSNDKFEFLSDPNDVDCDDEIVPGKYSQLRFSNDTHTNYGQHDWYIIWFYQNTLVDVLITSYDTKGSLTNFGPDLDIYNESQNLVQTYHDAGSGSTDTIFLTASYTGWYYLNLDNTFYNITDSYSLEIDTEDSYEYEGASPNNFNTSAKTINQGDYSGMVVSQGLDDWYRVRVDNSERLLVDIHWFSFIGNFNLSLYNTSDQSLITEGEPIYNGLRIGPIHTFNSTGDHSWYFIHVESDNLYPRYYNLTITIEAADDWAEDNDNFFTPKVLPAKSQAYQPTEDDPWGGLFSLKGDPDWFAISLLAGDFLTVRIDFNGTEGDLDMNLFDGKPNLLNSSELPSSNSETVSIKVRKSDVFLIWIAGKSGSYASIGLEYNMTVTVEEFDDSFESNDDSFTAAPIAEGNYTDLVLRDSDDDFYYIYLVASDFIDISLTYFANEYEEGGEVYWNDIDLDLFYSDESLANNSRKPIGNESLTFTAPTSGKYYIVCIIDAAINGASNAYNLTINIIESDDPYEDNDVISDATRINVVEGVTNNTVSSILTNLQMRVKDDDYYVTTVPAGLALIVKITFGSQENLDLELLSTNGSILDYSRNGTGVPEQVGAFPMNTNYTDLYNGTDVYFRVFMDVGLSATYTLNVTIGPEEILIPRQTVPPFTKKPTTKPKPFDPLPGLILGTFVGGALVGGGAAGIYGAHKFGVLDKIKVKLPKRGKGLGKGLKKE